MMIVWNCFILFSTHMSSFTTLYPKPNSASTNCTLPSSPLHPFLLSDNGVSHTSFTTYLSYEWWWNWLLCALLFCCYYFSLLPYFLQWHYFPEIWLKSVSNNSYKISAMVLEWQNSATESFLFFSFLSRVPANSLLSHCLHRMLQPVDIYYANLHSGEFRFWEDMGE